MTAVDYRESAGQRQEYREIEVIHQRHQVNQSTPTSLLTGSAVAVTSTVESLKNALSKK